MWARSRSRYACSSLTEQMGRNGIALQILWGEVVVTGGEFSVDLHPVAGRLSRTRHIGFHAVFDCSLRSLRSLAGMPPTSSSLAAKGVDSLPQLGPRDPLPCRA